MGDRFLLILRDLRHIIGGLDQTISVALSPPPFDLAVFYEILVFMPKEFFIPDGFQGLTAGYK
jgi:hypothetical protein